LPYSIYINTKRHLGEQDAFWKVSSIIKYYLTPFLLKRVPTVAPWRALNFGLDLQITYKVPLRFTTWQSA
jgi:hypothetical protein